jgi:hypothetical protein
MIIKMKARGMSRDKIKNIEKSMAGDSAFPGILIRSRPCAGRRTFRNPHKIRSKKNNHNIKHFNTLRLWQ